MPAGNTDVRHEALRAVRDAAAQKRRRECAGDDNRRGDAIRVRALEALLPRAEEGERAVPVPGTRADSAAAYAAGGETPAGGSEAPEFATEVPGGLSSMSHSRINPLVLAACIWKNN